MFGTFSAHMNMNGPENKRKRWSITIALILIATGIIFWILHNPEEDSQVYMDDKTGGFVNEMTEEPQEQSTPLPLVALLVGPSGSSIWQCLYQALLKQGHFRLVEGEQSDPLLRDRGTQWGKPVSMREAVQFGQILSANLIVVPFEKERNIAVINVLYEKVLLSLEQGDEINRFCIQFAVDMVRVIHAQGSVLAVNNQDVTIDLGWRSRIIPGTKFFVIRDDRIIGILTANKVDMDRCIANGTAQVGDIVKRIDSQESIR